MLKGRAGSADRICLDEGFLRALFGRVKSATNCIDIRANMDYCEKVAFSYNGVDYSKSATEVCNEIKEVLGIFNPEDVRDYLVFKLTEADTSAPRALGNGQGSALRRGVNGRAAGIVSGITLRAPAAPERAGGGKVLQEGTAANGTTAVRGRHLEIEGRMRRLLDGSSKQAQACKTENWKERIAMMVQAVMDDDDLFAQLGLEEIEKMISIGKDTARSVLAKPEVFEKLGLERVQEIALGGSHAQRMGIAENPRIAMLPAGIIEGYAATGGTELRAAIAGNQAARRMLDRDRLIRMALDRDPLVRRASAAAMRLEDGIPSNVALCMFYDSAFMVRIAAASNIHAILSTGYERVRDLMNVDEIDAPELYEVVESAFGSGSIMECVVGRIKSTVMAARMEDLQEASWAGLIMLRVLCSDESN